MPKLSSSSPSPSSYPAKALKHFSYQQKSLCPSSATDNIDPIPIFYVRIPRFIFSTPETAASHPHTILWYGRSVGSVLSDWMAFSSSPLTEPAEKDRVVAGHNSSAVCYPTNTNRIFMSNFIMRSCCQGHSCCLFCTRPGQALAGVSSAAEWR